VQRDEEHLEYLVKEEHEQVERQPGEERQQQGRERQERRLTAPRRASPRLTAPRSARSNRRGWPALRRSSIKTCKMLPRGHLAPPSQGGPHTFELDATLPQLPLPDVRSTISRCVAHALVFCDTNEDRARLTQAAERALREDSTVWRAQAELEKRHAATRNYVDAWWAQHAYLTDRDPIVPQESAGFAFGATPGGHPVNQTLRAALMAHASARLDADLRAERVGVFGPSPSRPYAMRQLRCMYETCRVPRAACDEQRFSFATDREWAAEHGARPRERRWFALGVRGRFYAVDLEDLATGEPLSVGALWTLVEAAELDALERDARGGDANEVVGLGFLTGSPRDVWARAREELIRETTAPQTGASPVADALDRIERAVCMITLAENGVPQRDGRAMLHDTSMAQDGGSRWYDKSAQFTVYRNGSGGVSMEHSVMDAAHSFSMHDDLEMGMQAWLADALNPELGGSPQLRAWREASAWGGGGAARARVRPLDFGRPSAAWLARLEDAKRAYLARRETVWSLQVARMHGVGKAALKRFEVSPDSFLQVALQTAYFRVHGRVPSTYETVGMLPFRDGRTEAGRSATMEARELCEYLRDARPGARDPATLARLVRRACDAHADMIKRAAEGKGVDRHVFAIKCQCAELGVAPPDLFTDERFVRASKWDLSTSHAFLGVLHRERGGTSFRPFARDMTGFVYSISPHHVDMTAITCAPEFDGARFLEAVCTDLCFLLAALAQEGAKL